jgi:hypothetical protein
MSVIIPAISQNLAHKLHVQVQKQFGANCSLLKNMHLFARKNLTCELEEIYIHIPALKGILGNPKFRHLGSLICAACPVGSKKHFCQMAEFSAK